MSKIKMSLHRSSYHTKPSVHELKSIKSDLLESPREFNLGNIKSFARMVGGEGHTFSAATFKFDFSAATPKAENFEQQQLFTLDFGDKVKFGEIKEKAELYDLPVLFAYEPFSDDKRIRVVFLNDTLVTDLWIAAAMQKALMTIFPETAPVSEKIFRACLGGRKLLYFDDSIPMINIESLFRGMSYSLKDRYGKNYRRKIIEFSNNYGIRLNKHDLLDISIEDRLIDDLIIAPQAIINKDVLEQNKILNENFSPSSIYYSINYTQW
jgi:hypothetical protein